jgi:hypothetical protein
MQNMDWLEEELGEYNDDYLIIDCPGTHRVLVFEPDFFLPCCSMLDSNCDADCWPACVPAGQIELYTHHPFLPTLVRNLQRLGMRTSAVYLLESQFMEDKYKFFRCVMKLLSS